MNVPDFVRASDMIEEVQNSDASPVVKRVLLELFNRFDTMVMGFTGQLRAAPTMFTVNPDTDPEAVSGAKYGDVAVYYNGAAVVTRTFDGSVWR